MAGLMMGTWFFATAAGNFLAAQDRRRPPAAKVPGRNRWSRSIPDRLVVIGVGMIVIPSLPGQAPDASRHAEGRDHVLAGENEIGEPAAAGTDLSGELKA